jgi:hypothetical protein
MNGFGAPAGGAMLPSRSAGRTGSAEEPSSPVEMKVPAEPASIAARLNAKACGPRYEVPDGSNTMSLM